MAYMYGAYSIAWVVIFGYLMVIGKRHSKLEKEIEYLKQLDK